MEALNRHLFILKISFSYLRPFSVAFFFDAKDFPSFDIKEFLDQHSGIINLNRPHRVDRCRTFLVFPFLDSSALPLTKKIPMLWKHHQPLSVWVLDMWWRQFYFIVYIYRGGHAQYFVISQKTEGSLYFTGWSGDISLSLCRWKEPREIVAF